MWPPGFVLFGLALEHGPAILQLSSVFVLEKCPGATTALPACVPLVVVLLVVERAPLGVVEVGFVCPDVPAVVGPRGGFTRDI